MLELNSELICEITGTLGDTQEVGLTPHGMRTISPITGGVVKGTKINGEVLPVGADWLMFRTDGIGELDVRATLRTDDGELIYCHYKGIASVKPDLLEKIRNGEDVDPAEYYFRTTPVFETGSEKYNWLNQIVCVGVGKFGKKQVQYKIYQIL